jgi:signal transduction histidine kinase
MPPGPGPAGSADSPGSSSPLGPPASPGGRAPRGRNRSAGSWARLALTALAQRRTWREFTFLVTGTVVAIPGFVLAVLGIVFSALSLLTIGLPFLTGVLWLGRRMNIAFRAHARAILGWTWPAPRPARLTRLVRDPAAWKTLGYGLLTLPIRYVGAYLSAFSLITSAVAITYPAWWFSSRTGFSDFFQARTWAGTWLLAAEGLVLLLALPWFIRLLVLIDRSLAYALLAPSRDQDRIAALEAGRAALQQDAAALMRRVERDLHDGTQARLVALGVTLSRIEHRAQDPSVKELAVDARGTVTDALAELRDIVRGLHPPALDDGLEVALTTLAGRSAVPAAVSVSLTTRPPDATASAVYFTVAELLTNVAKHADATRATVDLREDHGRLRLVVCDDGHGGARPSPDATDTRGSSGNAAPGNAGPEGTGPSGTGLCGTGLGGLSRRVAALDGSLTIDSPDGGPTVVAVTLPLRETP